MSHSIKRVRNAWVLYDWANSVYSLVITSSIFPIYYNSITSNGTDDIVHFLGMQFKNTALYSYSLSFSFLVVALITPLLSGIADYGGYKKGFMKFFSTMGAVSCSMLYFFNESNLWLGILAFVFAGIGYSGSIVFYNSYLPVIAPKEKQDRLSAKGYAAGYIGGALLLIFNLTMIMKPEWYGVTAEDFSVRFSFLLVGIWWFLFASITFYYLPKNVFNKKPEGNMMSNGYKELISVFKKLKGTPKLKNYIWAFFFISMGVQTVMYVAALFGDKELKLESEQLIITILIIQFVAIGGAYLFSYLSSKFGNINTLIMAVLIWIGICIGAYNVYTVNSFYILAVAVGLVMGGIQSLSRSTYSKILPKTEDHATYFSFYDVAEKIGIVIG
ncbi:MAG: MFS transporter, partial [Bacteroidia bacterium]|nr:MFS transporter [Bacteroidia bacterium]